MSDPSDTKYGDRIKDHDWSKPKPDEPDRTRIKNHEIDVIYTTDPQEKHGYGRKRFKATIRYDDETGEPYVLYLIQYRWKGNYWRDVKDLDWRDTPESVKQQVAAVLPVNGPEDLDSGTRLIDEGGESRWEKYHKDQMEKMDSGEMWGSSFLGDALDSAEKAAEAVRERGLDEEPVEKAVEEIQRAITVLKHEDND